MAVLPSVWAWAGDLAEPPRWQGRDGSDFGMWDERGEEDTVGDRKGGMSVGFELLFVVLNTFTLHLPASLIALAPLGRITSTSAATPS